MIFDNLYRTNDVMTAAMKGSEYKNQVILNNIANVDTPGFVAQDVDFETTLNDAVESAKITGSFSLDKVTPTLYNRHSGYKVRIDENNVDVESEMVNFYKNSTQYDVFTNCAINNKARIDIVLNGLK